MNGLFYILWIYNRNEDETYIIIGNNNLAAKLEQNCWLDDDTAVEMLKLATV